jgi:hypothetical protein
MIAAIEKLVRIFAITVPTFLPREKPISRNAKPACMNITRHPANTTHMVLIATDSCRTPLLYASSESADATAGIASRTIAAPTSAPRATLVPRCIGSPRIDPFTARSLGRGARTFFVHVSKIRAAAFGPPVEGRTAPGDLWPRG